MVLDFCCCYLVSDRMRWLCCINDSNFVSQKKKNDSNLRWGTVVGPCDYILFMSGTTLVLEPTKIIYYTKKNSLLWYIPFFFFCLALLHHKNKIKIMCICLILSLMVGVLRLLIVIDIKNATIPLFYNIFT